MDKTYIYILQCEDGSFYTGITKDVKKRMYEHFYKTPKGAKYTKSHRVQSIQMVWEAEDYSKASRLEHAIKKLTRKQKEDLIKNPQLVTETFIPNLKDIQYCPQPEFCGKIVKLLESIEE